MSRVLYLDFEFNRITCRNVSLVCAATLEESTGIETKWWLHNSPKNQKELVKYVSKFKTVGCYSAVAEARSYIALGLDPLDFDWLDYFLEYRMMTNHNDKLNWGKQLVDGKVKFFRKPPPKWERGEDDGAGFKHTHSLAEATYKLTGQIRDTDHKNKMRDLIISDPKEFSKEEAQAIMNYCLEDVVFLPKIAKKIWDEFHELCENDSREKYLTAAKWRGRYSAHTAWMETHGYPIDFEKTKNFSSKIDSIIFKAQKEINSYFPEVKPFRWNKKDSRYSFNQAAARKWIEENHEVDRWLKTDKGALSLSLEAFEKFYPFKHDYPDDNFGAQMVRFLKLKQSLAGFSTTKKKDKKTFWSFVGPDKRVRPYMNHYGAQSSRSQPGATGFMFLKPAWMRALVSPERGKFMAGIDYGQQEFFVAGLESNDSNMIDAYLSGDPYLYGAKLAGAIPPEGTKDSHPQIRNAFKSTYLGILFGMTKYGLAIKLTQDTGEYWDEDGAQEQIKIFEDSYPDYMDWKRDLIASYKDGCGISLPCDWKLWCDNDNERSVANVPIQGYGASAMRKAVDLAVQSGVKVLFTLHDAIYIEGAVGNESRDILALRNAMRDGFAFYAREHQHDTALKIKLDPFAWSPSYKPDSTLYLGKEKWEVPISNLYLDSRAAKDYQKFSPYFVKLDSDLL